MKLNLKMNFKMEETMRKWICLLVMCFVLAMGSAMAEGGGVVATNFPCYDFARQVAGDAAQVKMLIRPGAEVHSYEPSPADILSIGGADLFVYIGGESDVWVDGILDSFGSAAPRTLKLMDSVALLEEEGEHDHDHGELAYDEHIWTSPKNAIAMIRAVETALCEALPESAETSMPTRMPMPQRSQRSTRPWSRLQPIARGRSWCLRIDFHSCILCMIMD